MLKNTLLFLLSCLIPVVSVGQSEPTGIQSVMRKLVCLGHDSANRGVAAFLDSLSAVGRLPFATDDSVLFIFEGADTTGSVSWAGDFNGWNANSLTHQGARVPSTNLWICSLALPGDARLDYKVVVDGQWILDPRNTRIQNSGWGPNSELRMPRFVIPPECMPRPDRLQGKMRSHCIRAASMPGNYLVSFQVYLPAGCAGIDALPVCYVLDGHEYADSLKGGMVSVVDHLLAEKLIGPLIVVFIDPRVPGHPEENRRMTEYAGNSRYIDFLADELVGFVDSVYQTDPKPASRAIMGTSMGGWLAVLAGFFRSDCFGNLVVHSPAFDETVIGAYSASPRLKLKIFMSTGVFFDTQPRASSLNKVLVEKGYTVRYREVSQGHSWGNWKGQIKEPLRWMFPPRAQPGDK